MRDALRRGDVSIHRAWLWRVLSPNRQNEELKKYRTGKNIQHAIHNTIRNMLRKHGPWQDNVLSIEQFAARLACPPRGALENATLLVTELPGPAIVVTRDLYDPVLGEKGP